MEDEKLSPGKSFKSFCKFHYKGVLSFLIPIIALPVMLIDNQPKFRCGWLIIVMACFWIMELIPLHITSLITVFILPLLGILTSEEVCQAFLKDPLVMFLFSLVVALAIEYSNLHTRIALGTIKVVGVKPRRLLLGLFMVTYFVSMFLSNSAATAMMCPVIKAIMEELQGQGMLNIYMAKDPSKDDDGAPHPSYIAMAFYFAVAYASTIGGCGTLIGTGTNLTLKGLFDERFPDATDKMEFVKFLAYNWPWTFVMAILVLMYLEIFYLGLFRRNDIAKEVKAAAKDQASVKAALLERYYALGPMNCHEMQVLIIFFLMILLLFTKNPGFAPGWDSFFKKGFIKESVPTIFCVLLLFFLPVHYGCLRTCCKKPPFSENATPSLMSWKYTNDFTPWGLVFLLGGGYALATASDKSGMAKWLGEQLKSLSVLPAPAILFLLLVIATCLTNFSSNVAICNIIIPVVNELSTTVRLHPLYLVFPTGMATNHAYHLPVGTPPNAIIAGYAKIKNKYMCLAGIGPTIISLLLLLFTGLVWSKLIYPTINTYPSWPSAQ